MCVVDMHRWHRNKKCVRLDGAPRNGDNDSNYELLVRKFSDLLCAPLEKKRCAQQAKQQSVNAPVCNEIGPDLLLA
jgi:hypothetical protein